MSPLSNIAEKKINQAIAEGTLDCSRFKNIKMNLDDDPNIPDDMKIAYKMLKNAGYLPPELETRKEIHRIEELLANTQDEHVRYKQIKKLKVLLKKLDFQRNTTSSIALDDAYYSKIIEKTTLHSRSKNE